MSGKRKKNAAAIAFASFAASSLLTTSARAYITIGDFNSGNNDGFFDWTLSTGGTDNNNNPGADPASDLPSSNYTYSAVGATGGSNDALAANVPFPGYNTGYYQGLATKLQYETDSEGNSEVSDAAVSNMLAMDVTYNAAEWTGATYNNLSLIINFNNGLTGAANRSGFLTLADTGTVTNGQPTYDTGNVGYPGGWDPTDYPNVTSRTMYWDYKDNVPANYSVNGTTTTNSSNLTIGQLMGSTPGYVEFVLISSANVAGTFHIDNIRLTSTGPVNATWTNSAGANAGGTYSWGSLLNWVATGGTAAQSGNVALPSNAGDIVNFTDLNIGAPTTVTLNSNLDFQVNVGTMNFDSGEGYNIAQGSGGTLNLNGTTTAYTYSQTFAATTQTVTAGSAQINDSFGNQTISAPVNLATSADIAVGQATNVLTISGNISGTGGITLGNVATDTVATSVGSVVFTGSNSYTGGTTVTGGTLVVNDPVTVATVLTNEALPDGKVSVTGGTLQLGQSSGLTTITSLAISGNGTFDVYNNHVIINYGSGTDPISSIAALLATGYHGGAWNGAGGIVSTAAAANSANYGLGYADYNDTGNPAGLASGTIEIKYTLLGDVNLDGVVNGTDFGILAANFNKGVTGWDKGDFVYANIVNATDFGDLAKNFNKGASGASIGEPGYEDPAILAFAAANGLLADVPEPASVGLLAVGAIGLMSRRRRGN